MLQLRHLLQFLTVLLTPVALFAPNAPIISAATITPHPPVALAASVPAANPLRGPQPKERRAENVSDGNAFAGNECPR